MGCEKIALNQRVNGEDFIYKYWILLDTCFTEIIFCNPYLIDKKKLSYTRNTWDFYKWGITAIQKMAQLKIFTTKAHCNPESLSNIIPLKDVESLNGVTVTMNNSKELAINMLLPNDNYLVFKDCNYGLYHLNINNINKGLMADSCLKTVNKTKYI